MQPNHPSLDTIFPMSDAPSARLMKLKAHCLHRAGILSADERQAVEKQAARVLADPQVRRALRHTAEAVATRNVEAA